MTEEFLFLIFGLFGVVAVIGILLKPKLFVLIGVLVVVFSDTIVHLTDVAQISYSDEVLVVLAVTLLPLRRAIQRQRLRWPREFGWIGLVLVAGLLGNFIHQVPSVVTLLGALLLIKWFLLAFAVAQIDWQASDIERALPAFGVFALMLVLAGLLNFLFPGRWIDIFSPSGGVEERFGRPSLIGFFTHPSFYATITAFVAIAIAGYRGIVKKSGITLVLLLSSVFFSLLAFRRRLWLALVLGVSWVWAHRSSRARFLLTVLTIGPLTIFLSADFLGGVSQQIVSDYFTDAAEFSTARTVMTLDSLKIAASAFPLGVGFGRFGSYAAALYYSPEYSSRGYESIYGLAPTGMGNSRFLTDTFWPALLGETGWLGAVAFIMALTVIWRRFSKLRRTVAAPLVQWIGACGTGWLVFVLVDSIASPTFTGPLASVFFALVGVSASMEAQLISRVPSEAAVTFR